MADQGVFVPSIENPMAAFQAAEENDLAADLVGFSRGAANGEHLRHSGHKNHPLWADGYSPWPHDVNTTTSEWTFGVNDSLADLNTTDETPLVSVNYSLTTMVAVAVILILLIFATAFGNFLVMLALFKYRYLRTVSNYLIGNLALSDFLLATTILPLSGVNECLGYWIFGEIICNMWLCLDVLYCTASIWNLCIIALDRFTATLYPIWYREKRSAKQAAIYISVVWVFSAAICVPPLLGWNDLTQNYVNTKHGTHTIECILFQTQSYVLYSASGSFFIPFIITIFLYIRIFMVLHKRMTKMRAANRNRRTPNNNQPPHKDVHKEMQSKVVLNNAGKREQDIELSAVPNQSGSGNTEEYSSKSMFDSDSEGHNNDDDSSTQLKSDHPLYVSSSDAEAPKVRILRNGLKDRNKPSETLVILNPAHKMTSDSDRDSDADKVRTPLTKEGRIASQANDNHNKKNFKLLSVPTRESMAVKHDPAIRTPSGGRKPFSSALKHVNPFKLREREKPRTSQQQKKRIDQREVRATIRMAIIIAFFCGCWIGFFLIYVIRAWCPNLPIPRTLDAFFFWLGYANSAMNPILYTIFNDDFRRAFQKLLGCYRRNKSGQSGTASRTRH